MINWNHAGLEQYLVFGSLKKMFRKVILHQHRATNPCSLLFLSRNVSKQIYDLNSIKNMIDQKLKRMNEAKPNIPPPLQQANSSLCMVFENEDLRESISLGPTLPANKYAKYENFLNLQQKEFVIYYFVCHLLTDFLDSYIQYFPSLNLLVMERRILCFIVLKTTK